MEVLAPFDSPKDVFPREQLDQLFGDSRPAGMRWWDTRMSGREDDGHIDVLYIGDSIGEGWTSTSAKKSFLYRLSQTLGNHLGMGAGYYYPAMSGPAGWPTPEHNPWTKVGGADFPDIGLDRTSWYTQTNGDSISGTFYAEQFTILFNGSGTTGNARIYIDDVLVDTFNTAAAEQSLTMKWDSPPLDLGDHTIRIENNGSGSFIIVEGVMVTENADRSVRVWGATQAGWTAANWLGVGPGWNNALAAVDADLVIVGLGINDESVGRTPTQVRNGMEDIVDRVMPQMSGEESVALLIQWANGNDVAGTWDPYAEALRDLASGREWGVIDIDAAVGYTVGDPYFLDVDGVHPDDTGMRLWADVAAKYLVGGLPSSNPKQVVTTETHTYAIEGDIDTSKVFVPFHVSKGENEVLRLVGVRRRANGGSGTFTVRRNGSNVANFTGLTVNTTKLVSNPTPLPITDGDDLSLIMASGTLTGWATFTLIFERISLVA